MAETWFPEDQLKKEKEKEKRGVESSQQEQNPFLHELTGNKEYHCFTISRKLTLLSPSAKKNAKDPKPK